MIEPTNIVLAQMLLRRALQKQVVMLGHFVSYTLQFPNKNTQVSFCLETLAVFAPSEPTRFGSAMKIYKYIFAALTSLMFHVKHVMTRVAKIYL